MFCYNSKYAHLLLERPPTPHLHFLLKIQAGSPQVKIDERNN